MSQKSTDEIHRVEHTALRVWRVVDGKTGHENMTLGLVEALEKRVAIRSLDVAAHRLGHLTHSEPLAARDRAEHPGLVIGAGHRTHLTVLRLARRLRARSVVVLRPSLPLGWFDYRVIPSHDHPPLSPNTFVTHGVLNRVRPAEKDLSRGLILVGGPSTHHNWLDEEVCAQVRCVISRHPHIAWDIADSRRTPITTSERLARVVASNARFHSFSRSTPGWLGDAMAGAGTIWVSEDSVSMLYEALTAGAATGLIAVPRRRGGRVMSGVNELTAAGLVSTFSVCGPSPAVIAEPLAEAARCADWLLGQCPALAVTMGSSALKLNRTEQPSRP